MFPLPPAISALLIANLAGFALQWLVGQENWLPFALWPLATPEDAGVGFAPWQLVTYSFLHANPLHLAVNMFALATFGTPLARVGGTRRLLTLYGTAVLTAAATQLLVPPLFDAPIAPTLGASGGVFGLLLAYAVLFPRSTVLLIIPPIPMPAWLFATLYAAIELVLGVTQTQAGVAHFAHLGGALGGMLVLWRWRRR
ncbi:MAG: rhomboid family intramembrane serine protease [Steroidobacterales bacterium]